MATHTISALHQNPGKAPKFSENVMCAVSAKVRPISLTQDNHTHPESNFEQTMRQFILNINTQMNTVLESLKLKADKAKLVVVKQDIQQMNNRISTLEVSKQPSNTVGINRPRSKSLATFPASPDSTTVWTAEIAYMADTTQMT